jgi:hypothetical protein
MEAVRLHQEQPHTQSIYWATFFENESNKVSLPPLGPQSSIIPALQSDIGTNKFFITEFERADSKARELQDKTQSIMSVPSARLSEAERAVTVSFRWNDTLAWVLRHPSPTNDRPGTGPSTALNVGG